MYAGLKNVLITTEDMRYLQKAKDHQETLESSKADLRFVFNDEDTPLGSSKVGEIMTNNAVSHGEEEKVHLNFFTSMMTTLEMHTRSKYLVLNCASYWHLWIYSLRLASCGRDITPVVFCLDKQSHGSSMFICNKEFMHLPGCQEKSLKGAEVK